MIHPLSLPAWLGISLELVVLALLMGGLTLYQRRSPLAPETSRKLFHIGGGLTTLSFPWLFASVWPVVFIALCTILALLAVKYIRALRGNLGTVLYRVERTSFGEVYFPISVALLFACAGSNSLLFLVPLLILILADPAAAMIGSRYGRRHYTFVRGRKSLEGSATFFVVALGCTLLPLLLFTSKPAGQSLLIATLVGLLVMLAEALAWEGLDNLSIPVCSALLLAGLLPLPLPWLLLSLLLTLGLLGGSWWLVRGQSLLAQRKASRTW